MTPGRVRRLWWRVPFLIRAVVYLLVGFALGNSWRLFAQTQVGAAQLRSGTVAAAILRSKVAELPAQCGAGEFRFVGDASIESGLSNVFLCVLPDTWIQFGYAAGASGAIVVECPRFPCTIDVKQTVVPMLGGANSFRGANDFSRATKTAPFQVGPVDPPRCDSVAVEFFYNTSAKVLKACTAPDSWSALTPSALPFFLIPAGMLAVLAGVFLTAAYFGRRDGIRDGRYHAALLRQR